MATVSAECKVQFMMGLSLFTVKLLVKGALLS